MQIGGMLCGSLSLIRSWIGCTESHEILLGASMFTRSDAAGADVLRRAADSFRVEAMQEDEAVALRPRRVALVAVAAAIISFGVLI